MVELLRLERKEAYSKITDESPEHQHLAAESSRRTVWSLLVADDSLTVAFGYQSQARLTVTINTPCDEDDWDFGSIPTSITPEIASRSLMGNTVSLTRSMLRNDQKLSLRYRSCRCGVEQHVMPPASSGAQRLFRLGTRIASSPRSIGVGSSS